MAPVNKILGPITAKIQSVPVGHLANWTMHRPIHVKLISISIDQVLSFYTTDKKGSSEQ